MEDITIEFEPMTQEDVEWFKRNLAMAHRIEVSPEAYDEFVRQLNIDFTNDLNAVPAPHCTAALKAVDAADGGIRLRGKRHTESAGDQEES